MPGRLQRVAIGNQANAQPAIKNPQNVKSNPHRMVPNDEGKRRGPSPTSNQGTQSQSSIPSLATEDATRKWAQQSRLLGYIAHGLRPLLAERADERGVSYLCGAMMCRAEHRTNRLSKRFRAGEV